MSGKNIKSEVVSSFERNGKTYIILELDSLQSTSGLPIDDMQPESAISLPNFSGFDFKAGVEGTRISLAVSYSGNEVWRGSFDVIPSGCYAQDRVDLGDVAGVKTYLRWMELCYNSPQTKVHFKTQVWAEYKIPIVGQKVNTKLGEFEKDFDL